MAFSFYQRLISLFSNIIKGRYGQKMMDGHWSIQVNKKLMKNAIEI